MRSLLALCAVTLAHAAFADDGSVGLYSGLVSLVEGEDAHIVMESARVNVDMSPTEAHVDCRFVFHNTGPAKTVLMGFPKLSDEHYGHLELRDFQSWVGGTRVQTTWRPDAKKGDIGAGWHTKRVHFRRGQTRTVRDTYRPYYGGTVMGDSSFYYPMHTGASWKGPIGLMEVTVRLRGFGGMTVLPPRPEPTERHGGTVIWRWHDIEPGQAGAAEGVGIRYYPWYAAISVNGRKVDRHAPGPYAVIRNRRAFIPVADYERTWSESARYDPTTRTAHIRRGDHQLRFTIGSRDALVDDLGGGDRRAGVVLADDDQGRRLDGA